MTDKINKVSNPLTIIAIFAGLAEIAATVALGLIDQEIQNIFIWFVMCFPIILVVLFFITLNFNPKVLYAPSDFTNEENFLQILTGKEKISEGINEMLDVVKLTKEELSKAKRNTENKKMEELIHTNFKIIEKKLLETKTTAESLTEPNIAMKFTGSSLQAKILELLIKNGEMDKETIRSTTKIEKNSLEKHLNRLIKRGLVSKETVNGIEYYKPVLVYTGLSL